MNTYIKYRPSTFAFLCFASFRKSDHSLHPIHEIGIDKQLLCHRNSSGFTSRYSDGRNLFTSLYGLSVLFGWLFFSLCLYFHQYKDIECLLLGSLNIESRDVHFGFLICIVVWCAEWEVLRSKIDVMRDFANIQHESRDQRTRFVIVYSKRS